MGNSGICPHTFRIRTRCSLPNLGWRSFQLFCLPEVSESERWGSPVARPGKIVCVGLNFSDHAKESGMPVPTEPVLFLKATNRS